MAPAPRAIAAGARRGRAGAAGPLAAVAQNRGAPEGRTGRSPALEGAQKPIDNPTIASACVIRSPWIDTTQPPEQNSVPLLSISVR